MKTTETMDVYRCDAPNCKVERIAPEHEEPEGLHGTAWRVADWGSTEEVQWYACSERHIHAAVAESLRVRGRPLW